MCSSMKMVLFILKNATLWAIVYVLFVAIMETMDYAVGLQRVSGVTIILHWVGCVVLLWSLKFYDT